MAGIVSATVAQVQEARRRVAQLEVVLQQFAQGTKAPTTLNADQITAVDAAVDAAVAALTPLNT